MMTASRAYEANVTAVNVAKSMMLKALEIRQITADKLVGRLI